MFFIQRAAENPIKNTKRVQEHSAHMVGNTWRHIYQVYKSDVDMHDMENMRDS